MGTGWGVPGRQVVEGAGAEGGDQWGSEGVRVAGGQQPGEARSGGQAAASGWVWKWQENEEGELVGELSGGKKGG